MDTRRQAVQMELSRLFIGDLYDIDQLTVEELSRMQRLLARRTQLGLEGLSEEDIEDLERLIAEAMVLPYVDSSLRS
jgi:hypothetical protein